MKKAISILIFFPFFCLGQWNQVGNSINGQNAGDSSGYSTAISADGSIVAIGSNSNDNGGNSSGQVRVFDYRMVLGHKLVPILMENLSETKQDNQ